MEAKWCFSPAVSLDDLHGEAKTRAQKLYEAVDEAAVVKINAKVESEFEKQVASQLSFDTSSEVRNSLLEGAKGIHRHRGTGCERGS